MKAICIIPARSGSKRIPKKNIKLFFNKPIIYYSIKTAIESNLFDKVIVSTEDKNIANIALAYGASVPFLRSIKNSSDRSTTFDVIAEVIKKFNSEDYFFEYSCCLYPTASLVTPNMLIEGFDKLINSKFDCVFPVIEYDHPIYRSFKLDSKGKLEFIFPENLNKRTQDFQKLFHDSGQFYWMRSKNVLEKNKLITDNSSGIIFSRNQIQDIDNIDDWKLAELKYTLNKRNY